MIATMGDHRLRTVAIVGQNGLMTARRLNGPAIRRRRLELELGLADFCKTAGVSPTQMKRIESGDYQPRRLFTAPAIATAGGVQIGCGVGSSSWNPGTYDTLFLACCACGGLLMCSENSGNPIPMTRSS